VNLADAFEKLGEFELAEKHYYEAIALGLKSPIPFLGLGELFLKTGRYSLAVESFQKGVAIDSANEALQDGLKVATERIKREKVFFTSEQMKSCLVEDEQFRLMCMCPVDYYSFLRKWICMPVIAFSPGSANLTGEARRQLDAVAEVQKMKELDGWAWLITGHADSMGESNRNTRISKDRAESVKRYLVNRHAIDAQKLRVVFFGQDRPCGSNSSLEGRAENRRVEIVPESP
jgi:outer membrane protein OmpA-like peptidoglycan-associated protein